MFFLSFYLWRCWVFFAVWACLCLQASHCGGFSCCGAQALRWVGFCSWGMHSLSCSVTCGIFPDQGSNLCLLLWQADSVPLSHQGTQGCNFDSIFLEVHNGFLVCLEEHLLVLVSPLKCLVMLTSLLNLPQLNFLVFLKSVLFHDYRIGKFGSLFCAVLCLLIFSLFSNQNTWKIIACLPKGIERTCP